MFQASLRKTVAVRRSSTTFNFSSSGSWRQLSSSSCRLESRDCRTLRPSYSIGATRINLSFTRSSNGLLLQPRSSPQGGIFSHQRRYLSDEKKPEPKKPEDATAPTEETGRLGSFVPALRQRVTDFNTGDLVSVYGIGILILVIVFAPFIANQMRKSENTYEELEFDDPIAHSEKVYRSSELSEEQRRLRLTKKLIEEGGDLIAGSGRPATIDNTVDMIADVLHSEALQSALAGLITRVLDSDQFQQACQMLLKNLWNDLVNDPETTAQIVQLLQNAIQNNDIQLSFKKLVMQIVNDKEVYDELTRLLVRLGNEKQVLKATQELLTESTHNALNDPEILDHSMEFATDVVGDDIVQRTSGEALRNTVTYAVRPGMSTFLSIVGVGLLLFGLSAFANARASEHEAAIVEKAMTTVARNLQTTTAEGVGVLLSIPGRLLSMCLSLLTGAVSLPVKLLQGGLSGMGRTGQAAVNAITVGFSYIGSLPGALLSIASSSASRAGKFMGDISSRVMHGMLTTVSGSFVGVGYRSVLNLGYRGAGAVSTSVGAYSDSFGVMFSGLAKTLDNSTAWIDATINSIAKTTSAAASSAIQSSEAASEAISNFIAKLMESVTKRGGGGETGATL